MNTPTGPLDPATTATLDAAVAAARDALAQNDPVAAARHLEPHEALLDQHDGLAIIWATLLNAVGAERTLARQIRRLTAAWPRHPTITLECAAAATRWADPWPADHPPDHPAARLAALGADITARCIDNGGARGPWLAPLHLALARALARSGPRHDDKALAAFQVALEATPDDARAWADLARLHQQRRRFAKALGAAEEALRHADHRPARWTAAVAATALADPRAADHFARLDHLAAHLDPDGRPHVDGLPPVEVVLWTATPAHPMPSKASDPPDATGAAPSEPIGEAIWVEPISPCHGRIATPTLRDLPADIGDTILWDPLPLSFRDVDGAETPRFGALATLTRGPLRTWRYTGAPSAEPTLPPDCHLYPFADRVRGADATGGKLVAPRDMPQSAVEAILTAAGLTRVEVS